MADEHNTRTLTLVDRGGDSPAARRARAIRRGGIAFGGVTVFLAFCVGMSAYHVTRVSEIKQLAEANYRLNTVVSTRRGDVLDRNGSVLATSLRLDALAVDTRPLLQLAVPQRKALAEKVSKAIEMPLGEVEDKLARRSGFLYVKRRISPEAAAYLEDEIAHRRLPGFTLVPDFVRYYPKKELMGSTLGRVSPDGAAREGLELYYDRILAGRDVRISSYKDHRGDALHLDGSPDIEPFAGSTVVLTLDEKIQAVAEQELERAVSDHGAVRGMTAVMDVETGELLAMASVPRFNPNNPGTEPQPWWKNSLLTDQFEPGSTMKVFTMATALSKGVVSLDDIIDCSPGRRVIGNHTIHDVHAHGAITAREVIKFSSNVGISKVADKIGKTGLHDSLEAFGFGQPTGLGFAGEVGGMLSPAKKWADINLANIAFGQGVAVTAVQMTAAMAALGNGGVYVHPRLVREIRSPSGVERFAPETMHRVITEVAATRIVEAMRTACEPGGTGVAANLPDYDVVGKTGTAQKVVPKVGYSPSHWISSFVGLVPAEKPKLSIFVMVDEPKGVRYGGVVAAPVFREVARFALPYLGVPKSPLRPEVKAEQDKAAAKELANGKKARERALKAPPPPAQEPKPVALDEQAGIAVASGLSSLVPRLAGLTIARASHAALSAGLRLHAEGSGLAISQEPMAGQVLPRGGEVRVKFVRRSQLDRESGEARVGATEVK